MDYNSQTINNPNIIKRLSHRLRYANTIKLIDLKDGELFLDFGTGDGHLLLALAAQYPNAKIYGYEPVDSMFKALETNIQQHNGNSITVVNTLEDLKDINFDCIGCFEVLEHFSEANQSKLLKDIKQLASTDGRIVISVPIEIGLTALFKNLVRVIAKQTQDNTSIKTVLKSVFGLPIQRQGQDYIYSHIGFNHKYLIRTLKANGFNILKAIYSPLPLIKGLFNSQVFFKLNIAQKK